MIENVNVYVNEENILHNYKLLRTLVREDRKILAVIKANGYGLGLAEVGKTCEKIGIDVLAVLDIPQAKILREAGLTLPIQLLGTTRHEDFNLLEEYDLIQMIPNLEYARLMNEYSKNRDYKLKGHVKVNTGLNRLGIHDYNEIKACFELEHVDACGIYSHFVEAQNGEGDALEFSKQQIEDFNGILKKLDEDDINYGMTHMQNSPSILQFGDLRYDALRCGMILFGLFHPTQLQQALDLGFKETLSLKTYIAQVRTIQKGETIGYARSYKADKEMKIATIASGYCDGIMKSLSLNNGGVIIKDTWCPILGDIAMSQFMVDVSGIECNAEDEVIVFGHPNQTIYDYISITGQSINELISHLRYTMPRIYTNRI